MRCEKTGCGCVTGSVPALTRRIRGAGVLPLQRASRDVTFSLYWGMIGENVHFGRLLMSIDFIHIKSLEGELKFVHKRREVGMTVSTREFVLQKPHVNYHVKLEDIVSIVPFEQKTSHRPMRITRSGANGNEVTSFTPGAEHYRVRASRAVMHNRSGIFELGAIDFILPLHGELLPLMVRYGELDRLDL